MSKLFEDPADPSAEPPYRMREPCRGCGHEFGRVIEVNHQDTVRCLDCDRHCYNAPRTETGRKRRTVQTTHDQIKPSDRARIIERANGRCEFCGRSGAESPGGLHVAHLLSVIDGHANGFSDSEINDDDNLAAACAECNLGQSKRTVSLRTVIAIQMVRLRRGKA